LRRIKAHGREMGILQGEESAMATYSVTFFKQVLSSDGHPFKAPQERMVLRADSPEAAVGAAKHQFVRIRHIPDWMLHADTVEVEACGSASANRRGRQRA
jgi:hypothetical protein